MQRDEFGNIVYEQKGHFQEAILDADTSQLARNITYEVRTVFGNQALIYTRDDVLIPQPWVTSETGMVDFYADPGNYTLHIGETALEITVPISPVEFNGLWVDEATSPLNMGGHYITNVSIEANLVTTDFELDTSSSGQIWVLDSASDRTCTLPSGGSGGGCWTFFQKGAGKLIFTAESPAVLRHLQDHTKSAGQDAVCSIFGDGADYRLVGQTAA